MIDLAKITADNAVRQAIKARACPAPWYMDENQPHGCTEVWSDDRIDEKNTLILDFTHCEDDTRFVVYARNDNAEEVIDALVAEIRRLRTVFGLPFFPDYDSKKEGDAQP